MNVYVHAAVLLIPHPGTGEGCRDAEPRANSPASSSTRYFWSDQAAQELLGVVAELFLKRRVAVFAEHDGEVLVVDAAWGEGVLHKPGEVHLPGAARDLGEALGKTATLRISFSMLSRTS